MNSIKSLTALVLLFGALSLGHADITLKDTHGKSTALSELKGKWVFINYWAGWCPSCIEEIPELNRFYKNHQKDPVVLYAVNYDGLALFEQQGLIGKYGINYPSLIKNPATELNLGDINGVPVTFVINPEGKLVKALYGGQSAADLNAVMALK